MRFAVEMVMFSSHMMRYRGKMCYCRLTYRREQCGNIVSCLCRCLKEKQAGFIGILLSSLFHDEGHMCESLFCFIRDHLSVGNSHTSVSTALRESKSLLLPASAITIFGSAWRCNSFTHAFAFSSEACGR